jgi:hypothetical protein
MLTTVQRQWFQKRVDLADELVQHHARQGEPDAEILLCCAISALASQMWPGKGKDKKRFVQLLVDYSPNSAYIQRVSTCVLIRQLQQKGATVEADKIIAHRFPSKLAYYGKSPMEYAYNGSGLHAGTLSQIVHPDDIDVAAAEVLTLMPILQKEVRKASYVSIIYSDLRSGLIHEYELSDNLSTQGWQYDTDTLSYVNYLQMPDEKDVENLAKTYNIPLQEARDTLVTSRRRLYFPYRFIRQISIDTANSVFDYWDRAGEFTRSEPTKWWIEE